MDELALPFRAREVVGVGVKRLLVSAVMIATLVATVTGFAATLGMGTGDLAAGDAPVAECDTSFTHAFTTSGGLVTQVDVGEIALPGCQDGRLSLTLIDSAGASIGTGGPVTVTATSHAVQIATPRPEADKVAGIHIVVVGP